MATVAQTPRALPGTLIWVREFLREELAPYPGRVGLVARMVIAATIVMIICMAFRIPYGFQGAIFALSLPARVLAPPCSPPQRYSSV